MRYLWFVLLLSLGFSVHAGENSVAVTENDPSTLVEGVSVITGDLYIFEEDYVVQGAEPVRVRRSFISREGVFKMHEYLTATFLCGINRLRVNEPNGTAISYRFSNPNAIGNPQIGKTFYGEKEKNWRPYRYNAFAGDDKGVANTKTGELSARTNLKNQYILFDPARHDKGKSFSLYAADGTVREYDHFPDQQETKNPFGGKQHILYTYRLVSETLPNGHTIQYQWNQYNQVERIYTTNGAKTKVFASLDVYAPSKLDQSSTRCTIFGTDGRAASYTNRTLEKKDRFVPSDVVSPDLPDRHFDWSLKPRKINGEDKKFPYLEKFSLPKQRTMQIAYTDVEHPEILQMKIDRALA